MARAVSADMFSGFIDRQDLKKRCESGIGLRERDFTASPVD
jgi:hypothetical protein